MLMPKRVKYRKYQRGRRKGIATRGSRVSFGECGLQALSNGWLTNMQIEACRVSVMRALKGSGKLWIRAFPDKSVSKKPAETRMGKGKGMPLYWVSIVKRGKVVFELGGVDEAIAREAMRYAASKLPFKTRFVTRKERG
ncbi:MAG: 50S ribosomal protein L16 [Candidatus Omnitrophica bacterium]|nr:50S ribosomal protein L16 [Candidatus Omnitrophota bacterium]MBU4457574.1 50S ribosomal protein L16 [Candidatus Omnitrophota bacterium]